MKNIGIVMCVRYRNCCGGKCFRALHERADGFARYRKDEKVEIAGYSTCGGYPGGNVDYVPGEIKKTVPKSFVWPQVWRWGILPVPGSIHSENISRTVLDSAYRRHSSHPVKIPGHSWRIEFPGKHEYKKHRRLVNERGSADHGILQLVP